MQVRGVVLHIPDPVTKGDGSGAARGENTPAGRNFSVAAVFLSQQPGKFVMTPGSPIGRIPGHRADSAEVAVAPPRTGSPAPSFG